MKEYAVKAEMMDVVTGERKFPGDTFTPHDDDQAERLEKAGCLGDADDAPDVAAARPAPKRATARR